MNDSGHDAVLVSCSYRLIGQVAPSCRQSWSRQMRRFLFQMVINRAFPRRWCLGLTSRAMELFYVLGM